MTARLNAGDDSAEPVLAHHPLRSDEAVTQTKRLRSMLRPMFWLALGQGAAAGLTFLLSMFLINVLTKADYGSYYYYYALLTIASQVPGIAINNGLALRLQHTSNRNNLLFSYLGTKVIVSVGAMVVVLVLALTKTIPLLATLSIAAGLLFAFYDSSVTASQAMQRYWKFAALQPIRNLSIVVTVGIAYFLSGELTATEVLWLLFAVSLALTMFCLIDLSSTARGHFSRESLKELMSTSRRFFVFEVSAVVLSRIEVWILGYFVSLQVLTLEELAEYGAGFTFGFIFPIISSSVTSILVTKIVPGTSLGRSAVRKLLFASGITLVLALIYALASYALSKVAVPNRFTQLYWIIPALTIGMWMSFCSNFARVSLLSHSTDAYMNFVYAAQVLVGGVISYYLTESFGLVGLVSSFCLIRLFALVLTGAKFLRLNLAYAD